jgi:hypothetical protein
LIGEVPDDSLAEVVVYTVNCENVLQHVVWVVNYLIYLFSSVLLITTTILYSDISDGSKPLLTHEF